MPRSLNDWLIFIGLVLVANAAINTVARRVGPVAQILQGF